MMKIKKYSVWLLFLLFAAMPVALIILYATGMQVLSGSSFEGDNFLISPAFAIIITINHSTIFLVLLYLLRKQNLRLHDIGWNVYQLRKIILEISIGIALSFGLYLFKEIALDSFSAILQGRQPTFHSFLRFQLVKEDIPLLLVSVIFPFVEESIFRGYSFHQLRSKWPVWQILFVTSIIFGAMHMVGSGRDLTNGINTAILGALYFLIFHWRKNLIAPTAAHSIYNFLIVLT